MTDLRATMPLEHRDIPDDAIDRPDFLPLITI
jgi:hypothetical protein